MARTAARKPKSLSKPAGFAEEAQPFLHEDIMRGVPAKRVQELIDKGVLAEKTVYRVIPERTFKRRLANREALKISEGDAIARMVRITEEAEQIFGDPRHPYTKALLDSAPDIHKLMQLPDAPPGEIPDPHTKFLGCRYAGRCVRAQEKCVQIDPGPTDENGRTYFCHFPHGVLQPEPATQTS